MDVNNMRRVRGGDGEHCVRYRHFFGTYRKYKTVCVRVSYMASNILLDIASYRRTGV